MRGIFTFMMGLAIALLNQAWIPAIAQSSLPITPPVPDTELRGVWLTNIDSEVLFSRDNLERGIQRLHRLNFNTIYPTVWNGGYTLYPSAIAAEAMGLALDPYPGLQGRDMLAEAVELGHREGLTVIPWFEFGLMAPADSELARRHPDWISRRQDGSEIVMQGDLPRVWLNPMHPQVQDFLVNLIRDVAARYDVDGIQLDDHFGMPVELGYDPTTLALYQQTHNGQLPPDNPRDGEWVNWRASQLTRLMTRLYLAVKLEKPNCIISLSPNPWQFAYETYLQDWRTWERLGLLDELIVQVYRTSVERFLFELSKPELVPALQHIPVAIGILTGLRVLPVEMEQITTQVLLTRDRQFSGMAFFFYETLGDRDAAFQALFPTPAARPVRRGTRATMEAAMGSTMKSPMQSA